MELYILTSILVVVQTNLSVEPIKNSRTFMKKST